MDSISEDGILSSIISRLPVNEAIRTCILSKRWRHLPSRLAVLNLDTLNVFGPPSYTLEGSSSSVQHVNESLRAPRERFLRIVDQLLQQHSGGGVESFRVKFALTRHQAPHLDRWVEFAVASGAKELILCLFERLDKGFFLPKSENRYEFSLQYLRGSRITYLCLWCCCMQSPPSNFDDRLMSLKKIELRFVSIKDSNLTNLVLSCPVLERLTIQFSEITGEIMLISNPSSRLEYLALRKNTVLPIRIEAPGLMVFNYDNNRNYMAPLVIIPAHHLITMFFALNCVEHFEHYNNESMIEAQTNSQRMVSLKNLTIFLRCKCSGDHLRVASIMDGAPNLETLKLTFNQMATEEEVEQKRRPCKHPYFHLKKVIVDGFYGGRNQLELVKHILNNAVGLKLMILRLNHHFDGLRFIRIRRLISENLLPEVPEGAEMLILQSFEELPDS